MSAAAKLLPRHHEQFRSKAYWDDFFQRRTEAFEWYGDYADLRPLVHKTLKRTDRILVVGCGNSNFSAELYDDGFEEVENVDFSQPVVAEMCRAHSQMRPRMTWKVMDVTDMSCYEDNSFDAVVDKGTLDALMSENTPEVRKSGASMLREVQRVLHHGGRYMCVTLWQDFIGSTFMSSIQPIEHMGESAIHDDNNGRWTIDLHSVAATSKPSPYLPLCVIATKGPSPKLANSTKTPILARSTTPTSVTVHEDNRSDRGVKVAAWCDTRGKPLLPGSEPVTLLGQDEVLDHVREAQQLHRRRYDLRDIRPGRFEQEEIWGENESQKSPRFTLLIVDVGDPSPTASPCVVVLIPRGRDRDFTFSSREGLEQVAQSANARRLIAVRLNRGHDFSGGVEGVKSEISPIVPDFAPKSLGPDPGGLGIPIMAVSDGLGSESRVVAEGRLGCSGNYVVEEEEEEDDDAGRPAGVYRRLIFLENEGVVQTEVRLLGNDEEDSTSTPSTTSNSRSHKSRGGGKKGARGKGKGKKFYKSSSTTPAAVSEGCASEGGGGARVDSSHLCFEYHRCMVAGAALADLRTHSGNNGGKAGGAGRTPTALVAGLGGGALPMALRRMYPSLRVLTVELDPEIAGIAEAHFGLEQSDRLKVIVANGISFVNSAAAAAVSTTPPTLESFKPSEELSQNASGRRCNSALTNTEAGPTPALPHPSAAPAQRYNADPAKIPPSLPPDVVRAEPPVVFPPEEGTRQGGDEVDGSTKWAEVGWGDAFGPPYSAIFVDVDSKDTSLGMSSPPAAFLESTFLTNLKALLQGGDSSEGAGAGAGAGEGPPGVLAINVAARSKQLFADAVDAVCTAFSCGEVHKLRPGEDDVNCILLALPRPRGRARSGPLSAVAEQVLASAAVPRRAVTSILDVCEHAERVQLAPKETGSTNSGGGTGKKQASKGSGKRRGTS